MQLEQLQRSSSSVGVEAALQARDTKGPPHPLSLPIPRARRSPTLKATAPATPPAIRTSSALHRGKRAEGDASLISSLASTILQARKKMTPLALVKTRSTLALDNGVDIGSWTLDSPTSVRGGSYRRGGGGGGNGGAAHWSGGAAADEDDGGDGDMLELPLVMTPRIGNDVDDLALLTPTLGSGLGEDTERSLRGEPVDLIA